MLTDIPSIILRLWANIKREVHVVDKLGPKILIGMDIISSEQISKYGHPSQRACVQLAQEAEGSIRHLTSGTANKTAKLDGVWCQLC